MSIPCKMSITYLANNKIIFRNMEGILMNNNKDYIL